MTTTTESTRTTPAAADEPARCVVLVVDDEPGVRALARRILQAVGYDVVEAGDGAAALELINTGVHVDLLIADLDMPVMRGDDMAEQVRRLRPGLPILYVTAHVAQLFRERSALGSDEAFLEKPFTVRGLLLAVSSLKKS